ncbi:hypothetical protein BD770DRAFT_383250 [Pilaira anomala]|nr:hypothetical protein BD770DRAFT_383250 [Pilaira anomala]
MTTMSREECPCSTDMGALISREHFLTCRAILYHLFDSLPVAPPGVHQIDFALNQLPTSANSKPPAFWPDLLTLLWYIDTLCHPTKNIPPDPSPGVSWYQYFPKRKKGSSCLLVRLLGSPSVQSPLSLTVPSNQVQPVVP